MSRRSPQNPRYRRDAEIGTTRRSAASAKPKRGAGKTSEASAASKGKGKGKAAGKGGSSSAGSKPARMAQITPDTPEFKRWRRIWLGLLIVAIGLSLAAWFLRATPQGNAALIGAYACIFSAFFIELTKVRPMRREWLERAVGVTKKDKGKAAEKTDEATGAGEPTETKKEDV
jgi:hypothetical protein